MKIAAPFMIKKRVDRFRRFGFKPVTTFELMAGVEVSDETLKRLVERHGSERFWHMHELNGFSSLFVVRNGQVETL